MEPSAAQHEHANNTANTPRSEALLTSPAMQRIAVAMDEFVSQLQCAICLCPYERPASLPCNHCFCEECIHRALELKNVCPICKTPAKKRQLRYDSVIQQLMEAAEMWTQATPSLAAFGVSMVKTSNSYESSLNGSPQHGEAFTMEHGNGVAVAATTAVESMETTTPPRRKSPRKRARTRLELDSMAAPVVTMRSGHSDSNRHKDIGANRYTHVHTNGNSVENGMEMEIASDSDAEGAVVSNGVAGFDTTVPLVSVTPTPTASISNTALQDTSAFVVGQLVEIINRTWRGVNKPGGAARIARRNSDGTYNVKYILDARRERNVPDMYILPPSEDMVSEDTPSRLAKHRRRKATRAPTPPSFDLLASGSKLLGHGDLRVRPLSKEPVLLCSGFTQERTSDIQNWAATIGAQIVSSWSNHVTHLVACCATLEDGVVEESETIASSPVQRSSSKRALFSEPHVKRWVRIRSMKYLKALAAGRWIVSEEWLQECATQGHRVSEQPYEAEGHLKGKDIAEVCRRARLLREAGLHLNPMADASIIGSGLLADMCFHLHGEFLPPMPPPSELDSLIRIGGGHIIRYFDEIPLDMAREDHTTHTLIIISDRLNPSMLRRTAKELLALPQLQCLTCTTHVVSYQWLLNSISTATLRAFA